ncbi:unnamed protein product [Calypogeia fissa]
MERKEEEVSRKRATTTSCGDKEADVEMTSPFPQEIVDKIIAMMPFPSIFKARGLSKSWRARFSSISLLEGEEKDLAESFHKQVIGEWSKKWDSFCPVFVGEDALVAYGQKSRNWLKLSTRKRLTNFRGN